MGGRSSVKKSSVGPHCRLGAGVKLTNCILMDHVVVHDKVTMSNCIVCSNAEIGEGMPQTARTPDSQTRQADRQTEKRAA